MGGFFLLCLLLLLLFCFCCYWITIFLSGECVCVFGNVSYFVCWVPHCVALFRNPFCCVCVFVWGVSHVYDPHHQYWILWFSNIFYILLERWITLRTLFNYYLHIFPKQNYETSWIKTQTINNDSISLGWNASQQTRQLLLGNIPILVPEWLLNVSLSQPAWN